MGNRRFKVGEPSRLLGEVWGGPGCSSQESRSVLTPERDPP